VIVGTGLDIIEMERLRQLDETRRSRLAARILTDKEKAHYGTLGAEKRLEYLAGRFAAKEAGAKAWGVGIGRFLSWREMWVETDSLGKPALVFTSSRRAELARRCLLEPERIKIHLSITHTHHFALAQVILEAC